MTPHHARRAAAFVAAFSLWTGGLFAGVAGTAARAGAVPNIGAAGIKLQQVASGLSGPVAVAWRHGDTRMYVAEQSGRIRLVNTNGTLVPTPVLNLSTLPLSNDNEEGLLGFTFSANGTKLYVDYTGANGDIHVVEYTMAGNVANAATHRELLSIPHHAHSNHNGGEVIFGPDGNLYIGVGDGGGGGDPDGNAQNTNSLLGKILRINPAPSGGRQYTIPAGNPFVGHAGTRAEIWMYGLRNPWRFSFDRATHEMWIGDVGQNLYEEVDLAGPGANGTNWGWNRREGFHPYLGGAKPAGARDPLLEASHNSGYCALIGGYVYRGRAIDNFNGAYVFGDSCRPNLVGVAQSGGHIVAERDLGVSVGNLSTFGEDPGGELYAVSRNGGIYKLVAAAPPAPHTGYWESDIDGRVWGFHGRDVVQLDAAMGTAAVVGIAGASGGYWTAATNGAVSPCHEASYGSMLGRRLNFPVVDIASTPSARGYWLVATDGGIFGFGDAHFYGSTGNIRLNKPIVGMTSTPSGKGYWLVASDGGIFGYGDAHFYGSTGNIRLKRPIVGMAATPSGKGYWLVASDGGIFGYGDAHFKGSTGGAVLPAPVTGMARTVSGNGYWLIGGAGALYSFGDAQNHGTASASDHPFILGIARN